MEAGCWMLRLGPCGGLSDNVDAPLLRLDLGVDGLDANGSGDPTRFEGESRFDDAGDTTGGLTVAKIGFHLMAPSQSAKVQWMKIKFTISR